MNSWIRLEYERLRKKGWTARDALRAARVKDEFDDLENDGLVKLEIQPDDPHDASYVDTWTDMSPAKRKLAKQDILERANRDGTWCIVTYARASEDDDWQHVDSVGDFVGDDWKNSGYDTDVKASAIDFVKKARAA